MAVIARCSLRTFPMLAEKMLAENVFSEHLAMMLARFQMHAENVS